MEKMAVPSNQYLVDLIKNKSVDVACKFIIDEAGSKAQYTTVYKDLDRLFKRFQHLNKSKGRTKGKVNLDRFLEDTYKMPEPLSDINKPSTSIGKECESPFASTDDPSMTAGVYKSVCMKLAGEVSELRDKQVSMEEELNIVINEKDILNESVEEMEGKIGENRKNLKRTANRESYWREKCMKIDESFIDERLQNIKLENSELKDQLKRKEREINELKTQMNDLHNELENLTFVQHAEFYDEQSQTYLPELHSCVYSLLDFQVSCEHVSNVIGAVCQLLGKKPNKLPTPRTINNWSIERSLIVRRQISETGDNENTTLHTDEASKYGQKWGAFATRDSEGNYLLLGLRDMATKSSQDTLDTFKEILTDIDNVSKAEDSVSAKLLSNIKNTMSDRASTETKFNTLLEEYRNEILPTVYANYETMNVESQQAISRMNNFFCGLHTLVHMADVSQKSLYEVEKNFFDNEIPIHNSQFTKHGQSGTVRTIFTACKAFARRGDKKVDTTKALKHIYQNFSKKNNFTFSTT